MKLNIAAPESGTQKTFEIDDDKAIQMLYDKRISQEFDGGILGEKYAGYVFKITGGSDKQGFPMKQGVLVNSRVSLLLEGGSVGFQHWRGRTGERARKSVRGCLVGGDLSVLNLIVLKKGNQEIEGVTDKSQPRRLGPKRARKIMKLFDLQYGDDVRKYVIRRKTEKGHTKAPKIQRLVTPVTKQRRRLRRAINTARRERSKEERSAYYTLVNKRRQLAQLRKKAAVHRKRAAEEKKQQAKQ
eukprot:TRINITY_DN1696_c0_g1_i4.p3 TRINITY_DN1696_c0_g1~~TRINITY_DN1696_c0_g1_i4.p3  ORF type:complete len:242 (+),score=127.76 TRINITY_DN1696_c0_g1_i4:102-827(+)